MSAPARNLTSGKSADLESDLQLNLDELEQRLADADALLDENVAAAREAFEALEVVARDAGDRALAGDARRGLIQALFELGELDEATRLFDRHRTGGDSIDDVVDEVLVGADWVPSDALQQLAPTDPVSSAIATPLEARLRRAQPSGDPEEDWLLFDERMEAGLFAEAAAVAIQLADAAALMEREASRLSDLAEAGKPLEAPVSREQAWRETNLALSAVVHAKSAEARKNAPAAAAEAVRVAGRLLARLERPPAPVRSDRRSGVLATARAALAAAHSGQLEDAARLTAVARELAEALRSLDAQFIAALVRAAAGKRTYAQPDPAQIDEIVRLARARGALEWQRDAAVDLVAAVSGALD